MPGLLRKVANRLNAVVGMGIETTLMYEFRAGEELPSVPFAEGVTVRRLTPAGAKVLLDVPGERTAETLSRLQSGDVCYVAFLDGKLAHHSWVRRSGVQSVSEAGRRYPVAPGEFWIYHCWTASWARGKRIYPSVLVHAIAEHLQEGYTRARIYTSTTNTASQHGITRSGFRYEGKLRAFRFGPRCFAMGKGY